MRDSFNYETDSVYETPCTPPDAADDLARAAVTLVTLKQIHRDAKAGDTISVALPNYLTPPDIDATDLRTAIATLGLKHSPLVVDITRDDETSTASFQCI